MSGGYNYRMELGGPRESVAGLAGEANFDTNAFRVKWETEDRLLTDNHWSRSHLSVFGGAELGGLSPQYWDTRETRKTGQIGAQYARDEAWLHGKDAIKLETGYDADVRAVWTVGLDQKTRNAFTSSQNGSGTAYLGDLSRMLGDATASAGVHAGGYYTPAPGLMMRGGLRLGANAANYDSMSFTTGLQDAFRPSAYGEAAYRNHGVIADVLADVPLNDPTSYRMAAMAGVSPTTTFTLGASYVRERILSESYDRLRLGGSWSPTSTVDVQAGVDLPGLQRDTDRGVSVTGGVRVHF